MGTGSSSSGGINLDVLMEWDFHRVVQHYQIYALERVRQAVRFVTGDYSSRDPGSVTRMLQQLQWDTLEERRVRSKSIMLYRIQIHHNPPFQVKWAVPNEHA
jgi:hypothetical protein